MVYLLPKYKQKLKQAKPTTKMVRKWTGSNVDALRSCFECTDSLEEATDTVSGYVKFWQDLIVEEKAVKLYPNNKPWLTKEMRELLKRKRTAYKNGDLQQKRSLQRQINKLVHQCKRQYGRKIRDQFRQGNSKQVWKGLKTITG